LVPLLLLLLAFEIWVLIDISRRASKLLPKWAWVLITLLSVPTGGIIYLLIGRGEPET
jgi:hypothetical protein